MYSSGLLADVYFPSPLILASDGVKAICLDPVPSSTQHLVHSHSPNSRHLDFPFQGRCKRLARFQSTSIRCPGTTHIKPNVHLLPLKLRRHHLLLHPSHAIRNVLRPCDANLLHLCTHNKSITTCKDTLCSLCANNQEAAHDRAIEYMCLIKCLMSMQFGLVDERVQSNSGKRL